MTKLCSFAQQPLTLTLSTTGRGGWARLLHLAPLGRGRSAAALRVRGRTGFSSAFAIILFVAVFGLANIYVKVLNRVKSR